MNISRNFQQTCGNDSFMCEIHTHAFRFSKIFLLRLAQFSEQTPECDFHTHEFDLHKQNVLLTRKSVIMTQTSVIMTRKSVIFKRIV
jgi:hypothetical protein